MKIYFSPSAKPADLEAEIEQKARRLMAAYAEGKKYFLYSVGESREAVAWIFASFRTPLTLVPIAGNLPLEAKARIAAELGSDVVEARDLPAPGPAPTPKDLAQPWVVIFSSGSSGEPKGVALTGAALMASAESHVKHSGNFHWLLNLPLHHIGGLSVLSRVFFQSGEVSVAGPKFGEKETADWLAAGRVEGISLVPTTLHRLLAAKVHPHNLKMALVGGAPAGVALVAKAREYNFPVRLTYGMTEHSSQIATEIVAGSGLRPLPGVSVRIASDGEILVKSACLAAGYIRNGEIEPLPLDSEGYFSTGDLGSLADGVLTIEGRKSDMMISGGVKIFPLEIEPLLEAAGPEDCAVTSVPDPEWGEKVCALFVGDISPDTVKTALKGKIDPRKIPREWLRVTKIPRTAAGKIRRAELRRMAMEILN